MRCTQGLDENWELVVGYAARTLDPRAQSSFEKHMKSCVACRETVAVQQAVWDALDEWPAGAVSPDFDGRLQARIARRDQAWWRWTSLGRRLGHRWQTAMPVAAACVVFGVALWLYRPQRVEVAVPALAPVQDAQRPVLQLDKLEHALDDMDMLGKLSAGRAPGKAGTANRI